MSAWCLHHKGKSPRLIRRHISNRCAKKETCSAVPRTNRIIFRSPLFVHPLGRKSVFDMGASLRSFEVAIRRSFFDDDAESLGKKRLVVDVVDELGYTR